MNFIVLGLIFDMIGVSILTLVAIIDYQHQRVRQRDWWKRYWWMGWCPIWRNTQTLKWEIKWKHKVVREGLIPPNHQWNFVGLLFILIGFFLQILGYN